MDRFFNRDKRSASFLFSDDNILELPEYSNLPEYVDSPIQILI
jgi:hypothetical protein